MEMEMEMEMGENTWDRCKVTGVEVMWTIDWQIFVLGEENLPKKYLLAIFPTKNVSNQIFFFKNTQTRWESLKYTHFT